MHHAAVHGTESHSHGVSVTTAAHIGSSGEACFDLRDLDLATSSAPDPENEVADSPLDVSVAHFRAANEVRELSIRAGRAPSSAPQLPFYQRTLRLLI